MKKIIIFSTLFLLFLTTVQARPMYSCDTIEDLEGLCFDVTFAVTTDEEMKIPSKYNFPHFVRFGDHLYIKEVKIYNFNTQKPNVAGTFTLNIRPIDYIDLPYTDLKMTYPENYGLFTFDINSLSPGYMCKFIFNAKEWSYESSCKVEDVRLDRFTIELFKEGEWVIVDEFIPRNKSISGYGHTSIFNGDWKGNTFIVTSGYEMDNLNKLRTSIILVFLSINLALFVGLFQFYFSYKTLSKVKQKKNKIMLWLYCIYVSLIVVLVLYVLTTQI